MTWNHRFVKIKNDSPRAFEGEEYIYQLCEVYYNDKGEAWGFCTATPLYTYDPQHRFELACWIADAAARPVLESKDICASGIYPDGEDPESREEAEKRPPGEAKEEEIIKSDLEDESDTERLRADVINAVYTFFERFGKLPPENQMSVSLAAEILRLKESLDKLTQNEEG